MSKTTAKSTAISTVETPSLTTSHGHPMATSLQVAEHFKKRHGDVLRAIRDLECSTEFTERNFAFSEFLDVTGRSLPSVNMTKDGFAMLAFGFTGKEAVKWRESYINAFNAMEAKLRGLEVAPTAFDREALPRVSSKQMAIAMKQGTEQLRAILSAKTQEEKRQHYRHLVRINSSAGIETDSMELLGIERPHLKLEGADQ